MESRDIRIPVHKEKCSLPPWCIYIGYVLCLLLTAFSIVMVILYCFKFGYDESVEWVLAFLLSLLMSVLIIEPLKVGNTAYFFLPPDLSVCLSVCLSLNFNFTFYCHSTGFSVHMWYTYSLGQTFLILTVTLTLAYHPSLIHLGSILL